MCSSIIIPLSSPSSSTGCRVEVVGGEVVVVCVTVGGLLETPPCLLLDLVLSSFGSHIVWVVDELDASVAKPVG